MYRIPHPIGCGIPPLRKVLIVGLRTVAHPIGCGFGLNWPSHLVMKVLSAFTQLHFRHLQKRLKNVSLLKTFYEGFSLKKEAKGQEKSPFEQAVLGYHAVQQFEFALYMSFKTRFKGFSLVKGVWGTRDRLRLPFGYQSLAFFGLGLGFRLARCPVP